MSRAYVKNRIWTARNMILFMVIWLIWFTKLEKVSPNDCYIIHSPFDGYIPFCEYFVIFYFAWFLFVPGIAIYQLLFDEHQYKRLEAVLITGMLTFLIINTLFPTIIYIRPLYFDQSNIFGKAVAWLYSIDSPTNVLPSIHVYNTLAVLESVYMGNGALSKKKGFRRGCLIISIGIILSTLFLKQHSLVDVMFAFMMMMLVDALATYRERLVARRDAEKSSLSYDRTDGGN